MSDDVKDAAAQDDYEPDLITLADEEGEEHVFEVIDAADIREKRYFALRPWQPAEAAMEEEDGDLLMMRLGEEDGEEYLDIVDDPKELREVTEVFLERLSEVYDIDIEELVAGAEDDF